MTQEALAIAAGLDRSFYVDVEHGRHSIGLDRILALADALHVPVGALFASSVDKSADGEEATGSS